MGKIGVLRPLLPFLRSRARQELRILCEIRLLTLLRQFSLFLSMCLTVKDTKGRK